MRLPSRSPGRRLVGWLLSVAFSGILTIVLLEVLLRAGLYEALRIPVEAPIFVMESPGRIGLRPGVDVRSRGKEWDVRLITNHYGLRDVERPASESALRILGLGDSFTFGWGVPVEATYLARAEAILNRETGREIQIVKAAVPGWGPGDELAWLRENWDQWKPYLVLLGFTAGNDFYDTMVGGAEQYVVIDGVQIQKVRNIGGLTELKAFLRRHSATYRAFAVLSPGARMLVADQLGEVFHWPVNDIFLRQPPPALPAAIESTLLMLDQMHEFARARGAWFSVVVIPSRAQIHAEDYALFKSRFGMNDDDLDMRRPQRVLTAWAASRGVPFLDLEPVMSAAAARDTTRLYFRGDSHWTIAGHELASRVVARFLMDRGLVRGERAAASR